MDRLISTAIFALWVLAWAGGQAPASDSARAYDLHQLGNSLWDADSLPAADAVFRQALELRKEAKDHDGFLVTATNLGIINQILGNLTAARNYLGLVIDREPNRKLGQAYFQLARLYARTGEVVLSDQAFRVASDYAPFSTDSISRYYLYSEWSDAFLIDRPGQAMVADSLLGLAIALVDHLGDEAGYARAFNLNRRGLARAYSGQLESAIALLEESLVLNRECCEDQDLETSQLTNLGIAYRRQGRNEDAHRVLMASHRINLALSEGLPDPYLANDFDNLSTYYLESKPDSASLYAQLAVHALLPHLGSIDDFRLPQVERFPASGHPIGPEDFEQT
ncbi:MAG: tetratricopeptide repeat protein, partial [Bacteroidota bacterium]